MNRVSDPRLVNQAARQYASAVAQQQGDFDRQAPQCGRDHRHVVNALKTAGFTSVLAGLAVLLGQSREEIVQRAKRPLADYEIVMLRRRLDAWNAQLAEWQQHQAGCVECQMLLCGEATCPGQELRPWNPVFRERLVRS